MQPLDYKGLTVTDRRVMVGNNGARGWSAVTESDNGVQFLEIEGRRREAYRRPEVGLLEAGKVLFPNTD